MPEISIAAVWNGPPIDDADRRKLTDPNSEDLVARLAARRTPMEKARQLVGSFVVGSKEERSAKAAALFAALFAVLDAQA